MNSWIKLEVVLITVDTISDKVSSVETHRRELRAIGGLPRDPQERVQMHWYHVYWLSTIRRLCNCKTVEEVISFMILSFFLSLLSPEAATCIRSQRPETPREAARIATQYWDTVKLGNGYIYCHEDCFGWLYGRPAGSINGDGQHWQKQQGQQGQQAAQPVVSHITNDRTESQGANSTSNTGGKNRIKTPLLKWSDSDTPYNSVSFEQALSFNEEPWHQILPLQLSGGAKTALDEDTLPEDQTNYDTLKTKILAPLHRVVAVRQVQ